jgi:LEA14-like dessication related protein/RNA polymerase subunit RPABC4/transcription elongation factor Spt4
MVADSLTCPNCRKQISADFKLCPYCGVRLPLICPKCRKKVAEDFKLCPYCGAELKTTSGEKASTLGAPIPAQPPQYQTRAYRRKSHRGRNIAIACILVLLISGGIYYYVTMQQLKANLVDVGLLNAGLTSAQIETVIEVRNPSLLPIFISRGDFTIYVDNQPLGYGSIGSFTVGGNGLQRVTVPVSFSYTDIGITIANLTTTGGTVTVRLDGSLSIFIISVPFSTTL